MESRQPPELPRWPNHVMFVNTTACNLKCFMCFTNGPLSEKKPEFMPMPLFDRIMDEVGPHIESISLTNWGEPFADPRLPEILEKIARFPNAALIFQTNGTLLDPKHLALLKGLPNPVHFLISVDALDPVAYASIRPPGDLRMLLRNVRNLRQNAKEIGFKIEFIELNATLLVRNIAFAPKLVEFAASVGANGVRLLHLGAFHPDLKNESLYRIPVYTNNVLEICRILAAERGLVLNCVQPFAVTEEEIRLAIPEISVCDMTDSMVQISADGDVYLCCCLAYIGKLMDGICVADLWGGEEHERLRQGLWNGNPVGACKTCRNLESLTPYIYDSTKVGVDIQPSERCMDSNPDFELIGAFKWLDDIPEKVLRKSVLSGLVEAFEIASLYSLPKKAPLPQRLEAFLVRWARRQRFIMDNPRIVRVLSLIWETARRAIRRAH